MGQRSPKGNEKCIELNEIETTYQNVWEAGKVM